MHNIEDFNNDIINANKKLFLRYLDIIEKNEIPQIGEINKEYLIGFCNKAIHCQMLVDKQSRWLGFLQGVLFSMGLITIQEEREFSRQLFQEIYKNHGLQQETRSVF